MAAHKPPPTAARRPKGEGSVYQRADGLWVAEVTRNGTRLRRSGKTRAVAVARRDRAMSGSPADADLDDPTVADYLRAYYAGRRGQLRDQTHKRDTRIAENHIIPAIGETKLRDLRPRQVRRIFDAMFAAGLAINTVRNTRTVLSAACTRAVEDDVIAINPAQVALPQGNSRAVVPVSFGEAARLLDAIRDHPLRDIWALQLYSGLRIGEALGLDWGDIHLVDAQMQVRRIDSRIYDGESDKLVRGWTDPNTESGERVVPLAAEAVRVLWARYHHIGEPKSGIVFESPRIAGQPPSAGWTLAQFKAALVAAGMAPIHQHDLRHWCATLLIGSGVPLPVVAKILGHANSGVTARIYAHVIAEAEAEGEVIDVLTFLPREDRPH